MKRRPLITPDADHASTPELQALLTREQQAQEKLHQATEDYERDSHAIRREIGDQIRILREAFNFSQAQLGALIGLARNGLYTAENPDDARHFFSVARLLEIHAACCEVLKSADSIPRINRGRYKKS